MKYIIETEDVPFSKVRIDADNGAQNINLYRAKGFNALVFDQSGLDKLTPIDKKLDEIYSMGQDSAWDCIKKIASIPYAQRSDVFDGANDIVSIVQKYPPTEVIAKLTAYEEQQKADEIKVGNEVEAYSGRAVVFGTFTDKKGSKVCRYWYPSENRFDMDKTENLKKTGRYFPQVEELIKAIKGEQRDCHTCKHPSSIECVDCRSFGRWQPKEVTE